MVAAVPESPAALDAAPAAMPSRDPCCANCGAAATGRYCPQCGQETTVELPTARQFLREAAGRYVAMDGRLWRTLFALLFRPGFLTCAYLAGQRRRYVRPARLFLVLSLLMFAVFRVVLTVPPIDVIQGDAPATGSAGAETRAPDHGAVLLPGLSVDIDDGGNVNVQGGGALGAELKRRLDRFNALSRQDKTEQTFLGVMRYGPYAMFVMLPAFALLLRILYAGRSARHPARPRRYAEHLVFAAHDHAFFAAALTLSAVVPSGLARGALAAWALVYVVRAMKNVYGGRWIGVLVRAGFIAVAYAVLVPFVMIGLVLAAVVLR
jgi:hypothetical protein